MNSNLAHIQKALADQKFETARRLSLRELAQKPENADAVRRLLHEACLRQGDFSNVHQLLDEIVPANEDERLELTLLHATDYLNCAGSNYWRESPEVKAGMTDIAARTGWRALGVVPWLSAASRLPEEDAVPLGRENRNPETRGALHIAVPMLAHIANFDDLDPLRAEPGVTVDFVPPGKPIPLGADAIIIPGSKSTLPDLAMLRAQGWDTDILAMARAGTRILGLCGGYQMLGRGIHDSEGSDGAAASAAGLGLLDVETVMAADKTVSRSSGLSPPYGAAVEGYEIHMGRTSGPDTIRPLIALNGRGDGAISADGRVEGTYLHGLFGSDSFRHAWLASLGQAPSSLAFGAQVDNALDEIAAVLETSLEIETLLALAEAPGWSPTI